MKPGTQLTYLRTGRQLRATGTLLLSYPLGAKKVKPSRDSWGAIMVTAEEIEAGNQKGPITPRSKPVEPSERKKREKVPKPPPQPRWRQLVDIVRSNAEKQMLCFGELPQEMEIQVELADLLEAAQTMFSKPNAKRLAATPLDSDQRTDP